MANRTILMLDARPAVQIWYYTILSPRTNSTIRQNSECQPPIAMTKSGMTNGSVLVVWMVYIWISLETYSKNCLSKLIRHRQFAFSQSFPIPLAEGLEMYRAKTQTSL
jgi:hypothetical protein